MPPPDFTDQYNTVLSPEQEQAYQQWLMVQSQQNGRDMSQDNYDYDMRGAFLNGATQAGNMHWPDTFKKPNHPSFSDQSKYSGVNGMTGGTWMQTPTGWVFTPGVTTLQMFSPDALRQYFQRADPNVQLVVPLTQTLAPPLAAQPVPSLSDYLNLVPGR